MLHAQAIAYQMPSGEMVDITCSPPVSFADFVDTVCG
jgi:hypothetical protein